MLNVNQLRNGKTFEEGGVPFLVLKYEFTKMGRGTGNIKIKVRNLETGAVTVKTYITGNKVQDIVLQKKKMQFLYADGDNCVFMDPVSFEQIEIDNKLLEGQKEFLQDGMETIVLFWGDRALSIELPLKMVFRVQQTDPGEKGNSAAKVVKPAILENGMEVKVPLFINIGDKVRVKTDTGEYVERA